MSIVLSFICWNCVDFYTSLRPPFFFNPNCYMLSPLWFVTIRNKFPSRVLCCVFSHVSACLGGTTLFPLPLSSPQVLTKINLPKTIKSPPPIYIPASVVASFPLLFSLLSWFWFGFPHVSSQFRRLRVGSVSRSPRVAVVGYLIGGVVLVAVSCPAWLQHCYYIGGSIRSSRRLLSFSASRSLHALGLSLIFVFGKVFHGGICLFLYTYYSLWFFFVASSIWYLLVVAFRCVFEARDSPCTPNFFCFGEHFLFVVLSPLVHAFLGVFVTPS